MAAEQGGSYAQEASGATELPALKAKAEEFEQLAAMEVQNTIPVLQQVDPRLTEAAGKLNTVQGDFWQSAGALLGTWHSKEAKDYETSAHNSAQSLAKSADELTGRTSGGGLGRQINTVIPNIQTAAANAKQLADEVRQLDMIMTNEVVLADITPRLNELNAKLVQVGGDLDNLGAQYQQLGEQAKGMAGRMAWVGPHSEVDGGAPSGNRGAGPGGAAAGPGGGAGGAAAGGAAAPGGSADAGQAEAPAGAEGAGGRGGAEQAGGGAGEAPGGGAGEVPGGAAGGPGGTELSGTAPPLAQPVPLTPLPPIDPKPLPPITPLTPLTPLAPISTANTGRGISGLGSGGGVGSGLGGGGLGGGGLGGRSGIGSGIGSGLGGGAKLDGLKSLDQQIPTVAKPGTAEGVASAGRPPSPPDIGTGSPTGGGTAGGSGVPPMMPPMGGAGAAAGGGGRSSKPGSGAIRPNGRERNRSGGPTPGVPDRLRGKAGKKGTFPAVPVAKPAARRDRDRPDTLEILDEELWTVDTTPEVTASDQQRNRRLAT